MDEDEGKGNDDIIGSLRDVADKHEDEGNDDIIGSLRDVAVRHDDCEGR